MERKERVGVTVAALVLMLGWAATGGAVEFAGGTGEPNTPYQIATVGQLLAMDDDPNLLDKHFVLVADIDLDPARPGGKVFQKSILYWPDLRRSGIPGGGPFAGGFDGGGHAIRNCVFYNLNSYSIGLFESIGPSARITNLHLEDILVLDTEESGSYCGALTGENAGLVVNCSTTGTLLTNSEEHRFHPSAGGGLVGHNSGLLVDCHSQCNLFGEQVGGLVGVNDETGRVVFCSTNGLTLGRWLTGGLVGINAGTVQYSFAEGDSLVGSNSGMVRECYASGSGPWTSLIGINSGTVVNCYATGAAIVDSYRSLPGGLVGTNEGTIVSSYSARVLEVPGAAPKPLPLAGAPDYSGDVRQSYYLAAEKPESIDSRSYSVHSGAPTPLLAEEMQRQASFPGLDFVGDVNDGSQDHWFMPEHGYPVLSWQTEITGLAGIPNVSGLTLEQAQELLALAGFAADAVSYSHAGPQERCHGRTCESEGFTAEGQVLRTHPGHNTLPGHPVEIVVSLGLYDFADNPGNGSKSSPYQIRTAGQLHSLYSQEDLCASHFLLMADIDLTSQTYRRSLLREFSGTFDGNGHTIRYSGSNGLLGTVEPNGVVCNLTLEPACVNTEGYFPQRIGMLAGQNKGHIRHCSASGRILGGDDDIGGLVGLNEGTISHCTVNGRILGGDAYVGGLVGFNAGEIINCGVSVVIQADGNSDKVGGLAGQNNGTIVGCRTLETSVSGGDSVGGLIGLNYGSQTRIENSYAQGDVYGHTNVGGLVGTSILLAGRVRGDVATTGDPVVVIRNCYSACSVTGQNDTGGCIGYTDPNALQESCYFLDPNNGGGPDNGHGTALSLAAIQQQASFVDWDFETVWMICEGMDFPHLRWEGLTCIE